MGANRGIVIVGTWNPLTQACAFYRLRIERIYKRVSLFKIIFIRVQLIRLDVIWYEVRSISSEARQRGAVGAD